ncbi:TetR/AcrR family transcriptional regulator (plasmid) [Streptomyces sp. BI20]|uniref:TetR/AcrR family transcriptional regulator n=1 Tax=Streptomyces sp. BI20 TaxID=3403460 RepID=UPI003C794CA7
MSPKQQRGEATAERVLDAALRLYADGGEAGLTVAALTREGAVSPGSVYHHFGSLHGVLTALALRSTGRLLDALTTALRDTDGARAGVEAVVLAYLDFVREHPDAARLVHSAGADREVMARAPQLRASQEARLAPVAGWIHAHRATGELADLPAPLIEALVLGPVVAAARRALSVGDVDLDACARTLPDRIWRSVAG